MITAGADVIDPKDMELTMEPTNTQKEQEQSMPVGVAAAWCDHFLLGNDIAAAKKTDPYKRTEEELKLRQQQLVSSPMKKDDGIEAPKVTDNDDAASVTSSVPSHVEQNQVGQLEVLSMEVMDDELVPSPEAMRRAAAEAFLQQQQQQAMQLPMRSRAKAAPSTQPSAGALSSTHIRGLSAAQTATPPRSSCLPFVSPASAPLMRPYQLNPSNVQPGRSQPAIARARSARNGVLPAELAYHHTPLPRNHLPEYVPDDPSALWLTYPHPSRERAAASVNEDEAVAHFGDDRSQAHGSKQQQLQLTIAAQRQQLQWLEQQEAAMASVKVPPTSTAPPPSKAPSTAGDALESSGERFDGGKAWDASVTVQETPSALHAVVVNDVEAGTSFGSSSSGDQGSPLKGVPISLSAPRPPSQHRSRRPSFTQEAIRLKIEALQAEAQQESRVVTRPLEHGLVWLTQIGFTVSTVVLAAFWILSAPEEKPAFVTSLLTCAIAAGAYYAKATHRGELTLPAGNKVPFVRYIDWITTTPLMLYELCRLGGADGSTTMMILGCDLLTLCFGTISAMVDRKGSSSQMLKWFFSAGFFYLLMMMALFGQIDVSNRPDYVQELFSQLKILTSISWSCYPIVVFIGRAECQLITREAEDFLFVLLDIISKMGMEALILYSHINGHSAHGSSSGTSSGSS